MEMYFLVGAGGFLGAVLRYWVSEFIQQLFKSNLFFIWNSTGKRSGLLRDRLFIPARREIWRLRLKAGYLCSPACWLGRMLAYLLWK
jgi:hypothetical protein